MTVCVCVWSWYCETLCRLLLRSATACIIYFFNSNFKSCSSKRCVQGPWLQTKVYKNILKFLFSPAFFFLTPATFFEVAKHLFYKVSVFASFLTYCQIVFCERCCVCLRFWSTQRRRDCSRELCQTFCLSLGYWVIFFLAEMSKCHRNPSQSHPCPVVLKNGDYFLFAFKLGFKCFFPPVTLWTCAA